MAIEKKGMMFVLSSPSGVGKTTLTKKIAEHNPNFKISISYTTRKPRPNEINGADYCFVTEQEFNTLIEENNFKACSKSDCEVILHLYKKYGIIVFRIRENNSLL